MRAPAFFARSIHVVVVALMILTPATRLSAQQQQLARRSPPPIEFRADAIDVRSIESGTLQGGAGVNLPFGYYVRLEIDGAGGVTRIDDVNANSGRVDALARFLLDPFDEATWGLSIGGGMSARFGERLRPHQYLVVLTDLEMPSVSGIVPALQIGLGGGVRVGLVARIAQSGRR